MASWCSARACSDSAVLAGFGHRRVEHALLGVGMQRELEGHLVDEHPAIAMTGLQVLELALDDRVVVGDEVVDVAGQGGITTAQHAPVVGCGSARRRVPRPEPDDAALPVGVPSPRCGHAEE
ncbi:hypothetical protein [Pseudonocardia sp. MH-G8]|uniref:hypothetical protein n=1 Tax=Pseudonocardia sp. MH-G8 TaxID=1854588 RepID=UPI0018E93D0E|nr:hypothetical protein [Pseudonocardia sp. MH-G8]